MITTKYIPKEEINNKTHIEDKLYPLFSIIIPTFNSGLTLKDCLNSVAIQSFRNIEVIFIDGGSIDNTLNIIKEFQIQENDIKVKCISEMDHGIYDAMNKGIKLASGDYVYFLGSDDQLFEAKTLEYIANFIVKNSNVDIIYGNIIRINNRMSISKGTIERNYKLTNFKFINKLIVYCRLGICHQSIFARKKVLLEGFSNKYILASDFNWLLDQIEKRVKFKYINLIISLYNVNGTSSNILLLFSELNDIIKNHFGFILGKLFYIARKHRWKIK